MLFWSAFSRIRTEYRPLRIQSECGKMRTRITPNMDTFYVMSFASLGTHLRLCQTRFSRHLNMRTSLNMRTICKLTELYAFILGRAFRKKRIDINIETYSQNMQWKIFKAKTCIFTKVNSFTVTFLRFFRIFHEKRVDTAFTEAAIRGVLYKSCS